MKNLGIKILLVVLTIVVGINIGFLVTGNFEKREPVALTHIKEEYKESPAQEAEKIEPAVPEEAVKDKKPIPDTNEKNPIETPAESPVEVPAKPIEPVVETKTEISISFIDTQMGITQDETLSKGTAKIIQQGSRGILETTYHVTIVDGKVTSREKVSSKVLKEPVEFIAAIGSKPE